MAVGKLAKLMNRVERRPDWTARKQTVVCTRNQPEPDTQQRIQTCRRRVVGLSGAGLIRVAWQFARQGWQRNTPIGKPKPSPASKPENGNPTARLAADQSYIDYWPL